MPRDTDGYFLALALGFPSGVLANVDRGYEHEIVRAHAMNSGIWSGTLGYYTRVLMDPVFSPAQIGSAKAFFKQWVLPRGVAPAFRVGEVPYGVLPVVSFEHRQPWTDGDGHQAAENALVGSTSA